MTEEKPTPALKSVPTLESEMQRMVAEVKKHCKPMSKNELIRYIAALLVDNYGMTQRLQAFEGNIDAQVQPEEATNENTTA